MSDGVLPLRQDVAGAEVGDVLTSIRRMIAHEEERPAPAGVLRLDASAAVPPDAAPAEPRAEGRPVLLNPAPLSFITGGRSAAPDDPQPAPPPPSALDEARAAALRWAMAAAQAAGVTPDFSSLAAVAVPRDGEAEANGGRGSSPNDGAEADSMVARHADLSAAADRADASGAECASIGPLGAHGASAADHGMPPASGITPDSASHSASIEGGHPARKAPVREAAPEPASYAAPAEGGYAGSEAPIRTAAPDHGSEAAPVGGHGPASGSPFRAAAPDLAFDAASIEGGYARRELPFRAAAPDRAFEAVGTDFAADHPTAGSLCAASTAPAASGGAATACAANPPPTPFPNPAALRLGGGTPYPQTPAPTASDILFHPETAMTLHTLSAATPLPTAETEGSFLATLIRDVLRQELTSDPNGRTARELRAVILQEVARAISGDAGQVRG